jgi:hypothetical protein
MEPARPRRRFQFSIWHVVLMMTLIGGVLGVMQFFRAPPIRPITAKEANQIKKGMTQRQVMRVLGSPHRTEVHGTTTQWAFDFLKDTPNCDAHMEIVFDASGRAEEVRSSGYLSYSDATGRIVLADSAEEASE